MQIFPEFCGLYIHFLDVLCTKVFDFDEIQLIYVFLFLLVLLVSYVRSQHVTQWHEGRSFTVLVFRSGMDVELIFAYGV